MRCENVRSLILDYTTNELDTEDRTKVEAHIRECQGCNHFFKLANNEWKLLDEWGSIAPKADFITNFWNRVSNEEPDNEKEVLNLFKFWKLNWSTVSALSIFLVVGIISIILVTSNQYDVVYTERDMADEELLFDLDRTISASATNLLEVYGAWDIDTTQGNGG